MTDQLSIQTQDPHSVVIPIQNGKYALTFPKVCLYCCAEGDSIANHRVDLQSVARTDVKRVANITSYTQITTETQVDIPYCYTHRREMVRNAELTQSIRWGARIIVFLPVTFLSTSVISDVTHSTELVTPCGLAFLIAAVIAFITEEVITRGVISLLVRYKPSLKSLQDMYIRSMKDILLGVDVAMTSFGIQFHFSNPEYTNRFIAANPFAGTLDKSGKVIKSAHQHPMTGLPEIRIGMPLREVIAFLGAPRASEESNPASNILHFDNIPGIDYYISIAFDKVVSFQAIPKK